jgi:cell division GTPase FtsZ
MMNRPRTLPLSNNVRRYRSAAAAAISSPLLDLGIDRATGIVWNITGSKDLTLHEVNEAAEAGASTRPLLTSTCAVLVSEIH